MLDEKEWNQVHPLLVVNKQQLAENARAAKRLGEEFSIDAMFEPACDKYFEITGFRETNHNAIWHHRISLYGKPCKKCGKPLRTPKASFCAACGWEPNRILRSG